MRNQLELARLQRARAEWSVMRLKRLARLFGGGTPSKDNAEFWQGGEIPWVSPKDMKRRIIIETEDCITETAVDGSATSYVEAGSPLMVVRSGILRHTLPVAISGVRLTLNQDLKAFSLREQLDARFFIYWVEGQSSDLLLEWRQFGATVESIDIARMMNGRMAVPDVDTQRAIADFLDHEIARVDQLIEKKFKLLERLNERWEALLGSAVTGRLSQNKQLKETGSLYVPLLPLSWTLPRLKQLARVRGGITLGRTIQDGIPTEEVAYLRVANVQAGRLDLAEMTTIFATQSEISRFSLKKYDVLLNEGGDNDKLGRGAVWLGEIEPCLNQNHVFVAKPHSPGLASWISYCSNAKYGRAFFQLNSKQSTNLASIAKSRAEQFPVPMPPEKERTALLGLIDAAKEKYSTTRAPVLTSIERLREFRSSLITAAVTGQIDVATWGKRGNTDRRLDHIEKALQA